MKIYTTRAYTIDQETMRILNEKRNKSAFVCKAVKAYNKGEDGDVSVMAATDRDLLMELALRHERNSTIGQLIQTIRSLIQ